MSRVERVSVASEDLHGEPAGTRDQARIDPHSGEIDFDWTLSDG